MSAEEPIILYHSIFQQLFKFIMLWSFRVCCTIACGISSLSPDIVSTYDLMEILQWDRKTLLKTPDWNRPRQMELFGDFLC